MKVVNFKKIAFLFLSVVALTSCTKQQFSDLYDPNYLQEQAKEAFPVKDLDPTHTWEMMSTRTASVKVDGVAGAAYTVKIYSENPVFSSTAPLMAKTTATGGQTASVTFDAPTALERVFVSREGSDGYYAIVAELSGNQFVGSFALSEVSRMASRSVIVGGGDPFPLEGDKVHVPTADELAAVFPTSVPSDAYKAIQGVEITPNIRYKNIRLEDKGSYKIDLYANNADPENFYVVGKDVEISITYAIKHVNLYVLPGARLILKNYFGNQTSVISVAEGAELITENSFNMQTQNGLGYLYNRGTFSGVTLNLNQNVALYNYGEMNFSNEVKSQGGSGQQASTFYNGPTGKIATGNVTLGGNDAFYLNEGGFTGKDLTVGQGAFENSGDLRLLSLTQNNIGAFYNTGNVSVTGQTKADNSGCFWINKGSYETGSLDVSAKNECFYNYCKLIVEGKALLRDDVFHIMSGYMECQELELSNALVELSSKSVINVLKRTYLNGQSDGVEQGFRGAGDEMSLVKLGGETVRAYDHKHILRLLGNLYYAIENIFEEIPNGGSYPNILIEDAKAVVFDQAIISPLAQNQCAPVWSIGTGGGSTEDDPYLFTYGFEDMTKEVGDYDFNDVVLQVTAPVGGKIQVTLLAAGATKELRVGFKNHSITDVNNPLYDGLLFDGKTVYEVLGVPAGTITNTVTMNGTPATVELEVGGNFSLRAHGDFYIIDALGAKIHIPEFTANFQPGYVPYAMRVPKDWAYPRERISIEEAYPDFVNWAQNAKTSTNWYDNPVADKVFYITR